MIHDPAIFYDEVSGNYYTYSTGAICQKSKDLVHWKEIGKVVERPPQESVEWTGSEDIWAPDIVKVGKEYRLYCSNSSWGVRQSCIFLAVADRPEGPFEPKGCVLKTTEEFPQSVTNAIDANIIEDAKTGEQYMLYGSFWGGCHVLKLNKTTGFAEEEGIGVCIARRPKWQSGSMEGPYMVYNAQNNYYYLFVSYGSLKSDYNIRVGRSRSICGPFIDFHGKDLIADEDEDNSIGLLAMCGYQWNEGQAYMGPCMEGKDTAMICSGDSGVYGMAGLILELSAQYPGVEIKMIPGVTAACAGAAGLGAPLTHDFAVVSLSDRLTPIEMIWERIEKAAQADFVICLYNPRSKGRPDYLKQACERIMKYRSPETVCGVASCIGRDGEEMKVISLKEMANYPADMFTTVFIGKTSTVKIGKWMVTPRGYLQKKEK